MVTEAEVRKPVEFGFQYLIALKRLGREFFRPCPTCHRRGAIPEQFSADLLAAFIREVEKVHPEPFVQREGAGRLEDDAAYRGPLARQYVEQTADGRCIRVTQWLDALMTDAQKEHVRASLPGLSSLVDGVAVQSGPPIELLHGPLAVALEAVIGAWSRRPHPREM